MMLADSATDHGVLVEVTGDAEPGRRCTLIRATSELGVNRRDDVISGVDETADGAEDRPTPLQVTLKFYIRSSSNQIR